MEADPLIVQAQTKLLKRSEHVIVMADSSKLRRKSAMIVAGLDRINTIVTDDGAQGPKSSRTSAARASRSSSRKSRRRRDEKDRLSSRVAGGSSVNIRFLIAGVAVLVASLAGCGKTEPEKPAPHARGPGGQVPGQRVLRRGAQGRGRSRQGTRRRSDLHRPDHAYRRRSDRSAEFPDRATRRRDRGVRERSRCAGAHAQDGAWIEASK